MVCVIVDQAIKSFSSSSFQPFFTLVMRQSLDKAVNIDNWTERDLHFSAEIELLHNLLFQTMLQFQFMNFCNFLTTILRNIFLIMTLSRFFIAHQND